MSDLPFVHLRVRTEFSFKEAYGRVEKVLDRVQACNSEPVAAITDVGTWGHPTWRAACEARAITPIYGVELPVVTTPDDKAKQPAAKFVFLAKNQSGLEALYKLVAKAGEQFYTTVRLGYRDVAEVVTTDGNLIVLAGAGARTDLLPASSGVYLMLSPTTPEWNARVVNERLYDKVLVADARYPTREDRPMYEVHAGKRFGNKGTMSLHLPTLAELRRLVPQADDEAVMNTVRIAAEIKDHVVTLPTVGTIKFEYADDKVYEASMLGAVARGHAFLDPNGVPTFRDEQYAARFAREFAVIRDKQFSDYFVLVADLIQWAKRRMLVGPGRGSSAGSLLCYYLGITDVDPIPFGLLFERFIDVTRSDWPDIDIDFADTQRDEVFTYLADTYGAERVARLGSILRYKPDSAFNQVCLELDIPGWEVKPWKDRIPPLPDGDTTYNAITTSLEHDPLGQQLVAQYPGLRAAADLEGHANTSGTHAAGVIVADRPLDTVCGIGRNRTLMVDKVQAEQLGMLKVDVLGLTTLSVLGDCLKLIGQDRDWLLHLPLDDVATYEVFKRERTAGIFQFEGKTQGGLLKAMSVDRFDDIIALGALSRPGPLDAGATKTYVLRRMGREKVPPVHPVYDAITSETYGIIAYQEQMMACLRQLGQMDWPTVSKLRKAINKKMGSDWFEAYRVQFCEGAGTVGMPLEIASHVWDNIVTFGSYAFNKSHAAAYGLISYWCAYLKAHHPLEFACAILNNPKNDEAAVKALRELVREGFAFTPVDAEKSELRWTVADGKLLGGLTAVKGIGEGTAKEILGCRALGTHLRPVVAAKLANPVTPFDDIFEAERRFAAVYADPAKYKVTSGPLVFLSDVAEPGEYRFLGKVLAREIKEKDGKPYVRIRVADDTDDLWVRVNRREYAQFGRHFAEPPEADVLGKWCIFKGAIYDDVRIVNVAAVLWLDPRPTLPKKVSP